MLQIHQRAAKLRDAIPADALASLKNQRKSSDGAYCRDTFGLGT
jgi:hypothetical protein